MNKVILIGNLASDPEYKQVGDTARCSFRLAVQRRYADSSGVRQADFLQIVCWRGLAETCAKYLAKGRKACVEGSMQTRKYNAQDGTVRYVTEIIADSVEFLGTAQTPANQGAEPQPMQAYGMQAVQTHMGDVGDGGFTELPDDSELPF